MPGPFTRKVITLAALAFTFAHGVFAFAFALGILWGWGYVLGAAGTRAIGLVVAKSFAIRAYDSTDRFGPLFRRTKAAGMAQTSTVVAIKRHLFIALASFATLAHSKE